MPEACWSVVEGSALNQGDVLLQLQVPIYRSPFQQEQPLVGAEADEPTEIQVRDLIVLSHTCDLVNHKLRFIALCPVDTIANREKLSPPLAKSWREVLKGRREGIHLLGPTDPANYRSAYIVDFREIISLPLGYVERHAHNCGPRKRLISPFLEHFSQAFGRFYMRIALPDDYILLP